MAKILFIVILLIFEFNVSSSSTDIYCDYKDGSYVALNAIYYCEVAKDPNIFTQESTVINSITGTHLATKSNDNVNAFHVVDKTLTYFPKGLEIYFTKLQAFLIWNCGLKQIRKSDLKPFPELFYIYLKSNLIEVIEADLFDSNPKLEFIALIETKIIHIDSIVFDNLSKLRYLWLNTVKCIDQMIDNSRDGVLAVINKVKQQCVNLEFVKINKTIKHGEIESKGLNFEELKVSLNDLSTNLRSLNTKLDNLESSQCGTKEAFTSILSSNNKLERLQSEIETTCTGIKTDLASSESKISQLQVSSNQLKDSLITFKSNVESKVNDLISLQNISFDKIDSKFNDMQTSQARILKENTTSIDSLTAKIDDNKSKAELSQDELKGSISDIEASISNIKASQNEVKSSLIKLKTSQNEIKIGLDDLKAGNVENLADKLETLEGHLMEFKNENSEKFDKIEKELASTRHKMAINFDNKIKGIEIRLMKKFEDVLEDKLGKILEEKLERILNGKSGSA